MVGYSRVLGLFGLVSAAQALQRSSLPISELKKQVQGVNSLSARDVELQALYPEYNLSTPIDHFHNDTLYEPHSDGKFNQRYWFDAQYYKPGGPVIVLCGGETSGAGRLPFLQKGIVYQLAKATNGLGVILEHRYYGSSIPTKDFSTESLRFLTTDQALADTAYFANNVKFAGLEDVDLSPSTTPWIAYGGSYAGAFVALLRKLYPDEYWGAISSSGVPEAIWDYYKYFEAAAVYGPAACVENTRKITDIVDKILIGKKGTQYVGKLKSVFGLPNVTHDADFASAINGGIYGLQSLNWDPTQSSNQFFDYCDIVASDKVKYPKTETLRASVNELITVAGYGNEVDKLSNHVLNYVGYYSRSAAACAGEDQDECFGTYDSEFYKQDDIAQSWRLWPYQYCTQWGYLQTGSGVPANELPLISRTIDLEYSSVICREAFNISKTADVNAINKYGGFDLSYPRLAWVDGEWDPWRAAGVHAIGLPERESTTSEPYILIAKAVHHWDENGLFPNETTAQLPPAPVAEAQEQEAIFVKAWLKEFKKEHSQYTVSEPDEL
ncbi:putative serine carboxypeptidase s28 protein [Rosellinia necatrix]|uniref:Putative serine carboxypeptidase s28 protein n=1 Tax=Rosellinia necatrix TaxID=77044 RepID=A0A1S7UNJ7_ROSNE|nr:putative serine carboxypeptidase s28 protein [Rosellinia necatrix]